MTTQQREYIEMLFDDGWKPMINGNKDSPIYGMVFQSLWVPVSHDQYAYALSVDKREVAL